jgi:hypothetical protein
MAQLHRRRLLHGTLLKLMLVCMHLATSL